MQSNLPVRASTCSLQRLSPAGLKTTGDAGGIQEASPWESWSLWEEWPSRRGHGACGHGTQRRWIAPYLRVLYKDRAVVLVICMPLQRKIQRWGGWWWESRGCFHTAVELVKAVRQGWTHTRTHFSSHGKVEGGGTFKQYYIALVRSCSRPHICHLKWTVRVVFSERKKGNDRFSGRGCWETEEGAEWTGEERRNV